MKPVSEFCNATNDIIVIDAVFCLFHAGLQRTKTPSYGERERTSSIPRLLESKEVAIHGFCLGRPILVEWRIGTDSYRQAPVFQEGALKRGIIAEVGMLHVVNTRRTTAYLSV